MNTTLTVRVVKKEKAHSDGTLKISSKPNGSFLTCTTCFPQYLRLPKATVDVLLNKGKDGNFVLNSQSAQAYSVSYYSLCQKLVFDWERGLVNCFQLAQGRMRSEVR